MTGISIDEERLNMEIRKFLKNVGVTSQREIEKAVREAAESGRLQAGTPVKARMTLVLEGLDAEHVVEHQLNLV